MKIRNASRSFSTIGIFLLLTSCMDFAKVIKENEKQFRLENTESHRYVEFMRGKVHYVVKSNHPDKPILIFSHGSPGSWDAYAHLMNDSVLTSKFTMISYDRSGFGLTTPRKPLTKLWDQAAVIKAIVDAERISTPIYLLGHSYGGPVVLRFANDYPYQTAGLILIASPADPTLEKPFWYNKFADWKIIRWLVPKTMRYSNDEIMPLGSELAQLDSVWTNKSFKVSIVHGQKDKLVPFDHSAYLKTQFKANIVYTNFAQNDDHFVLWTDIPKIKESILSLFQ